MINEPLAETLPPVRCTTTLKLRLQRVAAASPARELGAHVRFAVERYVEAEEGRLGLPPVAEDATDSREG